MTTEYKGWSVDLDKNLLHGPNSFERQLSPIEAEVMYALLDAKEGLAFRERIITRVWSFDANENSAQRLNVYIYRLRKILPPQVKIRNARFKGFWLDIGGTDASAQTLSKVQGRSLS